MRSRVTLASAVALWGLAACGPLDDITRTLPDKDDLDKRAEIAAKIEDEIVDYLECSGKLRPSTLARIQALLHDPSYETVVDLLTAPDDIAQLISLAGYEVEGAVILLRNVALVYEQGHVQGVLAHGWSGAQLGCNDTVTLACTAGTGSSQVRCGAGSAVEGIDLSFAGCMLGGEKFEGAVAFDRVAGDDSAAQVGFGGLTFDEVDRVDGLFQLDFSAGATAHELALRTGEQLAVTSHGGPDSGRSCGQLATLDAFRLSHQSASGVAELAGEVEQVDATYGVETFGDHLHFATPFDCACPEPGSGLQLTVPFPLPGVDDPGTFRLSFGEADVSGLCASVVAEVVDWPTECSVLDNAQADCGRAAAGRVVTDLLEAFCTAL